MTAAKLNIVSESQARAESYVAILRVISIVNSIIIILYYGFYLSDQITYINKNVVRSLDDRMIAYNLPYLCFSRLIDLSIVTLSSINIEPSAHNYIIMPSYVSHKELNKNLSRMEITRFLDEMLKLAITSNLDYTILLAFPSASDSARNVICCI